MGHPARSRGGAQAARTRIQPPATVPSLSVIQEGRLLARVRHPNVVTIYGAEQIGTRIGLWMEFVRGRTLKQIVDDGKVFSGAEAVQIGVDALLTPSRRCTARACSIGISRRRT